MVAIWPKLQRSIGLQVHTEVPSRIKEHVAPAGRSPQQLCKRRCKALRRENLLCACPNKRGSIVTLVQLAAQVAFSQTTGICQKRKVLNRMPIIHTKVGVTKLAGTRKTRRLLQKPQITVA